MTPPRLLSVCTGLVLALSIITTNSSAEHRVQSRDAHALSQRQPDYRGHDYREDRRARHERRYDRRRDAQGSDLSRPRFQRSERGHYWRDRDSRDHYRSNRAHRDDYPRRAWRDHDSRFAGDQYDRGIRRGGQGNSARGLRRDVPSAYSPPVGYHADPLRNHGRYGDGRSATGIYRGSTRGLSTPKPLMRHRHHR